MESLIAFHMENHLNWFLGFGFLVRMFLSPKLPGIEIQNVQSDYY